VVLNLFVFLFLLLAGGVNFVVMSAEIPSYYVDLV
jgi:hypothetical protein